jgi:triacylglycerol esterase/lipase EstA (alpha/beta hydrolase family)
MKMAFLTPFRRDKFPIYSDISMPTQSTAEHGKLLGILIPSAAREFGARHVHIVTHSKGGLDSRDFMARFVPPNFGIYSLHTVSGPHQGSPGPDYQLDAVGASATYSDDSVRTEIGALSPPNAGTLSLRVSEVAKFNERNLPALPTDQSVDGVKHTVQYRALSGDMNLDGSTNFATGNPTISYDETYGLPGQGFKPDSLWTSVLQTAYRIVGYVASTYTEEKKIFDGRRGETITYKVVREKLNPTFLQNDICVTRNAAKVGVIQELYYGKANHSTVASPDFAEKVLDSIRKIQPINVEIP